MFNQRFFCSAFPFPETLSSTKMKYSVIFDTRFMIMISQAPAKRILSLREPSQKMSKSSVNPKSRILLSDGKDEIEMKIRKAVTDSDTHISYDPMRRPGISNLLTILHQCRRLSTPVPVSQTDILSPPRWSETRSPTSKSPRLGSSLDSGARELTPHFERSSVLELNAELSELSKSFHGIQTPQFKEEVAHAVEACVGPIRAEFKKIRSDESFIHQVTRDGAERARQIATRTIYQVKAKIGLD